MDSRIPKGNSKLNKEEIRELEYLKSLVQTYYQDSEMLHDELYQLKSELTARYTNSEIKEGYKRETEHTHFGFTCYGG
jgi:hypothetical protein